MVSVLKTSWIVSIGMGFVLPKLDKIWTKSPAENIESRIERGRADALKILLKILLKIITDTYLGCRSAYSDAASKHGQTFWAKTL